MANGSSSRTSLRLSNLPSDVEASFVRAFVGGFVQNVVHLELLPSEDTHDNDAAEADQAALMTVECSGRELEVLRQCVQRGCFGRTDVRFQMVQQQDAPQDQTLFQDTNDIINEMQSLTFTTSADNEEDWKDRKKVAKEFHTFLYRTENADLLTRASDRDVLGKIFADWMTRDKGCVDWNDKRINRTAAGVMAALRDLKLLKTQRYKETVICTFAKSEGDFPPVKQRQTARARVFSARTNLAESKWGVSIYPETVVGGDTLVEKGKPHEMVFTIISSSSEDDGVVTLQDITMGGGTAKPFQLLTKPSPDMQLLPFENYKFTVRFLSKGTGVYRMTLKFHMTRNSQAETCTMARYIKVRSGDVALQERLKPTKPYTKKRRKAKLPKTNGEVVQPPKSTSGALPSILQKRLPKYYTPKLIQNILEKLELETELNGLLPKDSVEDYADFWQTMLWASEHQAKRDMSFFDLEDARLVPEGRYFRLGVPGLAEGRPSVLRGDIVFVTWNERRYIGRVMFIRQLEIGMELAKSFHKSFNANLDSVHIRFTFSRTTFRTSHHGCVMASLTMGKPMLFPGTEDARSALCESRTVANTMLWGNRDLNDRQQIAVKNILSGSGRPLPYIIYGPPGTGKTTTVTEIVYQLAKHPDRLKILLIAPSNDAADILVAKLSSHFPPSEMRRILAFSRSMDTVPMKLRPYCKAELSELDQKEEIEAGRIVVSTVNLAARFSFIGIQKGYFNVLCVDEAGHATEPEVVAVAANLMDFDDKSGSGQLILAGDPKQLGPIVPSDVCVKFGMSMSYMERLTLRGAYARSSTDQQYPPHLLTKLIHNYRSHPAIMKLPNEMFYENELLMCGNQLSTHNLARWEHLPKQEFPILFHAVHGENLREENSPSWFNPQEAAEVANYVDLLINQTKPPLKPEEIGVITPYNRQAHKIGTALKLKGISGVKVGSVETFQGQERRVIVMSTVRAENDLLEFDRKYNLGFVANEKRFNVAITRAKALLIVIGHPKVLATDKARWLPLLRFCKENGSWLGESWDEDEEDSEDELEGSEEGSVYEDAEEGGISAAVAQEGMAYVNREE